MYYNVGWKIKKNTKVANKTTSSKTNQLKVSQNKCKFSVRQNRTSFDGTNFYKKKSKSSWWTNFHGNAVNSNCL